MKTRLCACAVAAAVGISQAAAQPPWGGPPHGAAYYMLQALLSLGAVVVLILISHYLLKRLEGRPTEHVAKSGAIEIVDARHLGGGRWLYLVRVADESFLVGAGADGVGPIHPTRGVPTSHAPEASDA